MRAIAEAAEVSVGLAYNYFDGKEDLLRAIVETGIGQVQSTFNALDGPAGPEQRLSQFVHASLDAVRNHRERWQVLYRLRQQPDARAALQDKIAAITESIFVRLTVLMTELGSATPEVDARSRFPDFPTSLQTLIWSPSSRTLDRLQLGGWSDD